MQRMLHSGAGLAGAAAAAGLHAEVVSAPASAVSMGQVLQLIVGLVLVLALIGVCALALRRFPVLRKSRQSGVKVVESISLGTRDRLLVLDVDSTRLLIGISAGGMSCLHARELPAAGDSAGTSSEFASRLQQSVQAQTVSPAGNDTATPMGDAA